MARLLIDEVGHRQSTLTNHPAEELAPATRGRRRFSPGFLKRRALAGSEPCRWCGEAGGKNPGHDREKQVPFMTTLERIGREERLTKGIEVAFELKFGEAGLRLVPEIRANVVPDFESNRAFP
jgi:hypothetical protein